MAWAWEATSGNGKPHEPAERRKPVTLPLGTSGHTTAGDRDDTAEAIRSGALAYTTEQPAA